MGTLSCLLQAHPMPSWLPSIPFQAMSLLQAALLQMHLVGPSTNEANHVGAGKGNATLTCLSFFLSPKGILVDALNKGLAAFGAKLQTMGGFPVKYKPEEGKALAHLEVHKEAAEADLKALNKQWAPLKLWA